MIDVSALRQILQDAGPGEADDVVTNATRGFVEQLVDQLEAGAAAIAALAMIERGARIEQAIFGGTR